MRKTFPIAILVLAFSALSALAAPAPQPAATTPVLMQPSVYKQRAALISAWTARNVHLLINWEEERDASGNPTQHLADYLNAAQSNGCGVLLQLDAEESIPWTHPAIRGFTQPDEPDDTIVNLGTDAASIETYYETIEGYYKTAHAQRPDCEVYLNVDAWQFQWHKVNYVRLFAACDRVTCDYYYDARNLAWSDWTGAITTIAASAGPKFVGAYVATSFQNLGQWYPGERSPNPASVQLQVSWLQGQHWAWPIFPQSFTPFSYDSTPSAVAALVTQLAAPPASIPPTPLPATLPTTSPTTLPAPPAQAYWPGWPNRMRRYRPTSCPTSQPTTQPTTRPVVQIIVTVPGYEPATFTIQQSAH